MSNEKKGNQEESILLVAVDFSDWSRPVLRKAKDLQGNRKGRIVLLHVVDHDFVERCICAHLGNRAEIKKKLFLGAKSSLEELIRKEGLEGDRVEKVVCEGVPCIEINKKAAEIDAEMIIMGSQGKSGDMKSIFFGSTAERVLRFIKKLVLCLPAEAVYM